MYEESGSISEEITNEIENFIGGNKSRISIEDYETYSEYIWNSIKYMHPYTVHEIVDHFRLRYILNVINRKDDEITNVLISIHKSLLEKSSNYNRDY
ncbi:MAG: hypothetical protein EOO85_30950 [Pedobacter sp.]|nr:MAG: hypothetical protein EOO85_30950 [Pedobacter sp.]